MKPIPERVEEMSQEVWRDRWLANLEQAECVDEEAVSWLVAEFVKQQVEEARTETDQQAREEERKRIEAIFMEVVPPHALSLEDSVWLKRLLNKAFNHNK